MDRGGRNVAKKAVKVIDKHIDRDVELCRTTNARVGNQAVAMLVAEQISFTQSWEWVPFYRREQYRGASQVCVIRTHCNQYSRARRILEQMEIVYRKRLILHAVS